MKGPIKEHSEQLQDSGKLFTKVIQDTANYVLLDVKDHHVFVGTSIRLQDFFNSGLRNPQTGVYLKNGYFQEYKPLHAKKDKRM